MAVVEVGKGTILAPGTFRRVVDTPDNVEDDEELDDGSDNDSGGGICISPPRAKPKWIESSGPIGSSPPSPLAAATAASCLSAAASKGSLTIMTLSPPAEGDDQERIGELYEYSLSDDAELTVEERDGVDRSVPVERILAPGLGL